MQSLQSLRQLAVFDRDLIEDRATRFVRCRSANHYKDLKHLIADTVIYQIPGDPILLPCVGRFEGAQAILRNFGQFHIEFDVRNLHVRDVLVDGDRAAVHSTAIFQHRGTGLSRTIDLCDLIRFENGLIAEVVCFLDTQALASALAGLQT